MSGSVLRGAYMDVGGRATQDAYRDIGGRATQEQLPSSCRGARTRYSSGSDTNIRSLPLKNPMLQSSTGFRFKSLVAPCVRRQHANTGCRRQTTIGHGQACHTLISHHKKGAAIACSPFRY